MKLKIHGIILSLFFALAIGFSFSIEASAHPYVRSDEQGTYTHSVEDVTAEDVEMAAEADKEEMTRKFLLHAAEHLKQIQDDPNLDEDNRQERSREMVVFAKRSRDPGVFNHGDTYLIGITRRGATTNHALYQDLYGSRYWDDQTPQTELVRVLTSAGNYSEGDAPVCKSYMYNDRSRVACAIKQETPAGVITTTAGFDHAKEDLRRPNCSAFTLDVTAQMVEEEENLDMKRDLLKKFVKGVIAKTLDLLVTTGAEVFAEFGSGEIPHLTPQEIQHLTQQEIQQELLEETGARILEKVTCFREPGSFFHGSIYAFVMDPVRGTSFLNGLDFNLHGLSVSLRDPEPIGDEPNVLVAFQKAVTTGNTGNVLGDLAHGNSGTVTYHWDDPRTEKDNVDGFLGMGVVPGTSVKESYLEVVDAAHGRPGLNPAYYVFGSGIYLDEDDDDGCSIAATGSKPQSTLLNLFLIASVLFSVVVLRKRV